MRQMITALVVSSLFCLASLESRAADAVQLPAKEKFHLFILAGQSNMAGRGKVAAEDRKVHPRVLALGKDGKWKPAVDPLHWDKGSAGVGLGKSFAIAIAEKNKGITIGLVPTACGGSSISTWKPGGYHGQTRSHPYDDAIKRTKGAMKVGTLQGILWHQGESDSGPKAAGVHGEKLNALITRFRKDLNTPQLPFIIGQLGQFKTRPWNESRKKVDAAHQAAAKADKFVGFVASDGLTPRSDNTHFDSKSVREFGRRYAAEYLSVVK